MKKESRTNKYRGKRVELKFEELIKVLFKDIYYVLVGLVYIVVKTYVAFEKAFLKVWSMLPKWVIRIMVWVMLININILNDKAPEIIEKIVTNIEVKEVYAVKEMMVEPEKCAYGIYECAIYDSALEYGLNDEQAKIAIAISKHETGTYTSAIFKNNNNIGGLYNSSASCFYKYDSVEDGIDAYIRNLKNGYFDKGLNTIEKIQAKYAPLNAENDPTGLNNNWISGVTYFYNELV